MSERATVRRTTAWSVTSLRNSSNARAPRAESAAEQQESAARPSGPARADSLTRHRSSTPREPQPETRDTVPAAATSGHVDDARSCAGATLRGCRRGVYATVRDRMEEGPRPLQKGWSKSLLQQLAGLTRTLESPPSENLSQCFPITRLARERSPSAVISQLYKPRIVAICVAEILSYTHSDRRHKALHAV